MLRDPHLCLAPEVSVTLGGPCTRYAVAGVLPTPATAALLPVSAFARSGCSAPRPVAQSATFRVRLLPEPGVSEVHRPCGVWRVAPLFCDWPAPGRGGAPASFARSSATDVWVASVLAPLHAVYLTDCLFKFVFSPSGRTGVVW